MNVGPSWGENKVYGTSICNVDHWSWLKKQQKVSTHIDKHPPTPNPLLVNEDPQSHLRNTNTNPQSTSTTQQQHLLPGKRTPPKRHQTTTPVAMSSRLLGNRVPQREYSCKGEKIVSDKTVTNNKSKLQGKEDPPNEMSNIERLKLKLKMSDNNAKPSLPPPPRRQPAANAATMEDNIAIRKTKSVTFKFESVGKVEVICEIDKNLPVETR